MQNGVCQQQGFHSVGCFPERLGDQAGGIQ